jgi:hypothetical protein
MDFADVKYALPFWVSEKRQMPGVPDMKTSDFPRLHTSGVSAVAVTLNCDDDENVKLIDLSLIEPWLATEYLIVCTFLTICHFGFPLIFTQVKDPDFRPVLGHITPAFDTAPKA